MTLGDIQTLDLLGSECPSRINLEKKTLRGEPLMDIAAFRRDSNEAWSLRYNEPQDVDPVAWYEAFQDMLNDIQAREWAESTQGVADVASGTESRITHSTSDGSESELEYEDAAEAWSELVEEKLGKDEENCHS